MKKQSFFIVVIIVVALMIGIWRDHTGASSTKSVNQFSKNFALNTGTKLPQSKKLPTFEFLDMHEKPFTNEELKKHWSFLFFGYTSCPNICPTILSSLNQLAVNLRGLPTLQFIFVSIDPQQDSPKRLKQYLKKAKFSTSPLIGITGEMSQTIQLAQAMGAYVEEELQNQKAPQNASAHIEHSGTVFLINPEGKLTAIFTSSEKPGAIAHDFKDIMHQYANGA